MQKSRNGAIISKNVRIVGRILKSMGYILDAYQPHISGERELKSVTKLILLATNKDDGQKIVVKASHLAAEKKRIRHEKKIRDELELFIGIADGLLIPKEVFFVEKNGFLLLATVFIDQPKVFVAHSLKDQTTMSIKTLEAIENIDIGTFKKTLGKTTLSCPIKNDNDYGKEFYGQISFLKKNTREKGLKDTLELARTFFDNKFFLIPKYSHYLVHEDFCPHNFRVNNKQIFILDYTAMNFGNKYLTWARFLNYLVIHNPKLEKKIVGYVKKNRNPEELECLRLLRIYKTVFLIEYYTKTSKIISGKLLSLDTIRIAFWHNVLKKLLQNKTLSHAEHAQYIQKRDALRSQDEKKRQREFAVA